MVDLKATGMLFFALFAAVFLLELWTPIITAFVEGILFVALVKTIALFGLLVLVAMTIEL
jgi:hypothetical protein